jgi:catechol 2,3-dioxygenase-like lactoylglutathione lyase family enzyme
MPPAIPGARFGHVNLIARDGPALAAFYARVFGCIPVPPPRDYRGPDLDAGTGLTDAHLTGVHLRLPGHGDDGPTLEIYTYDVLEPGLPPAPNRPGFGHVAFVVPDVAAAHAAFLAAWGAPHGEIVTLTTAAGARVTWAYVRDPEGNLVELQSWA